MSNCPNVGGQAVLEGVMMRSPNCLAIAVKRSSGEIVVREDVWRSIWERLRFLRWPFLRGTVIMIEAMVNGMQALNFSAAEAIAEEEKKQAASSGEVGGTDSTEKKPGDSGLSMVVAIVGGLLLAIGLFKMLPHLAATYTGELLWGAPLTVDDTIYHFVDGIVKLGIFVGYVAVIGLSKDIKRVFMYHGAEHMSIYTLEAGEALTVENARKKSTLHPRCGTAFLMVVILLFVVIAALLMPFIPEWAKPGPDNPWYTHIIVVLLKLPLLIPVAGVAYEFNRFAGRNADNPLLKPFLLPGLAMQLLTTKRPSDDQIEIALASLRTVLWREHVGTDAPKQDKPVVYENFGAFDVAFPGILPEDGTS
jgi:uncharacterized protein YqhQ